MTKHNADLETFHTAQEKYKTDRENPSSQKGNPCAQHPTL